MTLSQLTSIDLIDINLESKDKQGVIKEMASILEKNKMLTSYDNFVKDVFEREKECTTGFGKGIAIPHGKSDAVVKSCFAIGRCKEVEWESLDGKPVDVVILIAVPKIKASTEHLLIISKLAENLMNDEFVEVLKNASTKEEIFKLLKDSNFK